LPSPGHTPATAGGEDASAGGEGIDDDVVDAEVV
jgi:hypothetical protein